MSTQAVKLGNQQTQIEFPINTYSTKQLKADNKPLLSFSNNVNKAGSANNAESNGISFLEGAEIVFQGAKDNLVNKVKDTINMFKEDPLKATVVTCAGLAIGAGIVAVGMMGPVGSIVSGSILAGMGGIGLFNQAKDVYEEIGNIKEADGDEEEIKEALYNIGGSVEEGIEDIALLIAGGKQIKAGVNAMKASAAVGEASGAMEEAFNSAYANAESLGAADEEATKIAYSAANRVYQSEFKYAQFNNLLAINGMDKASYMAGITAALTKQDDIQGLFDFE